MGGGKARILKSSMLKLLLLIRLGAYLRSKNNVFSKMLYIMVALIHRHYSYKTGIQIPIRTKLGGGLKISHYSGIVINADAKIGEGLHIYQGVTIGSTAGPKGGIPVIGDNVILCAGAKVIGNVRIGNNVVVGANAVVIRDVPDNCVVAGVPAKVISQNGKELIGYFRH